MSAFLNFLGRTAVAAALAYFAYALIFIFGSIKGAMPHVPDVVRAATQAGGVGLVEGLAYGGVEVVTAPGQGVSTLTSDALTQISPQNKKPIEKTVPWVVDPAGTATLKAAKKVLHIPKHF